MSIAKPTAKRALFQDKQIPVSQLSNLMTATKMSLTDVEKTAQFFRAWKGRDEIEPVYCQKDQNYYAPCPVQHQQ